MRKGWIALALAALLPSASLANEEAADGFRPLNEVVCGRKFMTLFVRPFDSASERNREADHWLTVDKARVADVKHYLESKNVLVHIKTDGTRVRNFLIDPGAHAALIECLD